MNSFGRLFRIQIFGESHGPSLGLLIDGCPAGVRLGLRDFLPDLRRRKSGRPGTTARLEPDLPQVESGLFRGRTTGAPLLVRFPNVDIKSDGYSLFRTIPRPGHADFAALKKYRGFHDHRGGGVFSGRLTLALVAAGVVAKKIIAPLAVSARLLEAGGRADIARTVARAAAAHDSVGGLVECRAENVPVGLGEPFFDSVESLISHLVFAIPGIKGIEFGAGFAAGRMRGSAFNDPFMKPDGRTATNNAGGISGGLANGNTIVFRVAVRPASSIGLAQQTINLKTGKPATLLIRGRHDACFALRLPVVVEATAAAVLADLLLRDRAWQAGGRAGRKTGLPPQEDHRGRKQ
jgi:chorismate synthase